MSDATIKRLDPELRELLRNIASSSPDDARCFPAEVNIIVSFRGDAADLERAGVTQLRANPHPDGTFIGTGRIETAKLPVLAAIEHLIAVDGGGHYTPDLNYSIDEIGAVALHNGNPALTGEGVIVGVIDSGIDWRHGAFLDGSQKSRILSIWDQSLTAKPATPATPGQPAQAGEQAGPNGIGVIYTQQQITDALSSTAALKNVRTNDDRRGDSEGHGTHVAGIAAGDGSPGTCCAGGGKYVGVAPKADLIVVKLSSASLALGASTNLVLALNYIFDQAKAASKAAVINISQGDNLGAHDGTSLVEREIDRLVLAEPGRVVIKSAGNEGAQNHHVRADIPQATAAQPHVEIVFEVKEDDRTTRLIDFWYDDGNELSLEVVTPGGVTSGVIAHGADKTFPWNPTASAAKQGRVIVDATPNAPFNNDHNIRIRLTVPSGKSLPAGEWKLRFANAQAAPVVLHGWLERGVNSPTFLAPDGDASRIRASKEYSISIPGTAKEVIAVANWEGRAGVLDCCPGRNIADSSSRGPVRKNAAGNPKPTLAAPGSVITSAQANACQLPGEACDCCAECCCSLYDDKTGTSMAAPHVAGAVALMFQLKKALTKAEVTSFLEQTAERPAGGDVNAWGAGKLNIAKAIEQLKQTLPQPSPLLNPGDRSLVRSRRAAPPRKPTARPPRHAASSARREAPPIPQLVEVLRRRVADIPDGELWANLVSKHFSEVRRLVNTKRKVATLWHRGDGPAMLMRVARGAANPRAPRPIQNAEQREYLRRMCDQLRRFGSVKLRSSLDLYEDLILRMLERPLAAQVVVRASDVPA
jgi:subtilisin family serine protease